MRLTRPERAHFRQALPYLSPARRDAVKWYSGTPLLILMYPSSVREPAADLFQDQAAAHRSAHFELEIIGEVSNAIPYV